MLDIIDKWGNLHHKKTTQVRTVCVCVLCEYAVHWCAYTYCCSCYVTVVKYDSRDNIHVVGNRNKPGALDK